MSYLALFSKRGGQVVLTTTIAGMLGSVPAAEAQQGTPVARVPSIIIQAMGFAEPVFDGDNAGTARALADIGLARTIAGNSAGGLSSFAQASAAVSSITTPPDVPGVLKDIATDEAKADDNAGAIQTFEAASADAIALPKIADQISNLNDIAITESLVGFKTQALATFAQGEQLANQSDATSATDSRSAICLALAKAGFNSQAIAMEQTVSAALSSITNGSVSDDCRTNIADAVAATGDLATATALFSSVRNKDLSNWHLAEDFAHAGRYSDAYATAGQIAASDYMWQVANGNVGAIQALNGDIAGAQQEIPKVTDNWRNSWLVSRIAMAQAQRGDITGAQATVKTCGVPNLAWDSTIEIAQAQARAGDIDGAIATATNGLFWNAMKASTLAKVVIAIMQSVRRH